ARRQAPGLRRHRRLRSEGGFALRLELRAQDHRLEQFLRRQPEGADGPHQRGQDEAGDRQRAAPGSGARGPAPDPGPRSHRQGRGHAVTTRRGASSMTEELTMERLQELITRAPYHRWLGLKVVAVDDDGIELK